MRALRTSLVLLALWGFLAPRAVACCCPKGSCDPHAHDQAETRQPEASQSCCHADAGNTVQPPGDEHSTPPGTSAPQHGDCRGCSCGMFCCAKVVTPVMQLTQYAAPVQAEPVVIAAESLPASITLSPILKPPRIV